MRRTTLVSAFAASVCIVGACSDDVGVSDGTGTSSTASSSSSTPTTAATGGSLSSTTTTGSPTSGSETSTGSTTSTGVGGSGGASSTPDPNKAGPYTIAEIDDSTKSVKTGDTLPIHCAYPTGGPTAGPYPVVVVAHGFELPASEYYGYVQRLASFGYVALTVDFPSSFSPNNVKSAEDLLAGVDWAASSAKVKDIADASTVGMTGHSLGGQLALLSATMDARVKASITLDPVDGAQGCNATDCPDVSNLMPIPIPTGFLGETTDASGGSFGMSCAPAADNYTTFYAKTTSPSLEVTVLGANHMSFLDDVSTCGFVCSFCNAATAPNAQVNSLAKAYVVTFYERYLRGDTAYDSYLTGSAAQARYVTTNEATILSR